MSKKRILIADDDRNLLDVLERRCEGLGLEVFSVDDAIAALNGIEDVRPDVICLDVDLPGGNGLAAAEMIRSNGGYDTVPLIIITGKDQDGIERRCQALPAYYIKKSSGTWENLEPLLREVLNLPGQLSVDVAETDEPLPEVSQELDAWVSEAIEVDDATESLMDAVFDLMAHDDKVLEDVTVANQPWILFIDDDHDFSSALSIRLEAYGIGVVNAFDGSDGVKKACYQKANAIILDYNMPNGNGDYVLQRLKENTVTRDIPVIVLTGKKDDRIRQRMINLGAEAFLFKPPVFQDLLDAISPFIDTTKLIPARADRHSRERLSV